jgi:hypothetical protein
MYWSKIGNVFCPDKNYNWMWSHAANPVPYVIDEYQGIVRVFFTTRNMQNNSFIGFVDVDFNRDFEIRNISEKPVISPGEIGMFDDSGTAMGYIIKKENIFFLFYLGWNLKVTVPWLNTIGVAKSGSIDGEFKKLSKAPIMDRSNEDPYSISYPSILYDDGKYKMWYGSNLSWGTDQSSMQHVIKYAESDDLINWRRTDEVHIGLQHKNEYAISKPWVVREGNLFKMWYSYRAIGEIKTYRIGYAESKDGKTWQRKDEFVGIDVSKLDWDCQMICYPSVFVLNNKTFMLYNGNDFGKTGFGIAILEK